MGLAEEFQADLATKQESSKFGLEQEFRAYLQDQAQGGSIRQAPIQSNPPIGAVVAGVGATMLTGNPAIGLVAAPAGEAIQQLVERAIGDPAAPQTSGDAALRMGREAITQGALEGVGTGAKFLTEKGYRLAPFGKGVTAEAKEAMRFVEQHGGGPSSLLPAEMTSNRFLDIMQNISEHSLLGGGAIQTFKQNRDLFNQKLAESIVGRYGPHMDPDAVGRAVVDSATRNLESAKFPAKFIYEAIESQAAPQYAKAPKRITVQKDTEPITRPSIDSMKVTRKEADPQERSVLSADEQSSLEGLNVKTTWQDIQVGEQLKRMKVMVTEQENQIGGTRIDLGPLKDDLAEMTRTAKESGGLADSAMGNTLLAFINKKPDLVSYPVAKAIRTEVRAFRDQLKNSIETKNAPGIGKADSIYGKLTERIRAGLADDDPFLADMWDEANLIEAGANQQFNTKFIRELVKQADMKGGGAPEAIAEKVWRAGRPTQIKVVRNALDPPAWNKMQRLEMDTLMNQSMENGVPNGKKMEAALFGPNGLGKEALTAGFDTGTVKELEGFVHALKTQQAKAPDGTGRVWIQLAQATAAVQAIGAGAALVGMTNEEYGGPGMASAGLSIMFGPAVVGRILASPGGIKWLTEGLTTGMKTKRGIEIATQLSKILEGGIARPGPSQPPAPTTQVQPMGNLQ